MPPRQHSLSSEAALFKHELHERECRITALEEALRERDLAVSRLEVQLEHSRTETQTAMKFALLAGSMHGSSSLSPIDAIWSKRINTTSDSSVDKGLATLRENPSSNAK